MYTSVMSHGSKQASTVVDNSTSEVLGVWQHGTIDNIIYCVLSTVSSNTVAAQSHSRH